MRTVLFLAILLSGCAYQPKTEMQRVVAAPLPWKHAPAGCGLYCDLLAPKLKQIGATDLRRIYFRSLGFGADAQQNFHTVLLYRFEGQEWIADNHWDWPTKVSGKDDEEKLESFMRQSFLPSACEVKEAHAL